MAARIKDENNDRAFASDEQIDMQAGVAFAAEGGMTFNGDLCNAVGSVDFLRL
jgi:hypothetical protein